MRAFAGKTVFVPGGGSGIGKAMSLKLASQGATVLLLGLREDRLELVEEAISQAGGKAYFSYVDVTDYDAYRDAVDAFYAAHGNIDYLFNNAGVTLLAEALDTPIERWRRLVDVNLMGVVNGIQLIYPRMAKAGFGHIVSTASLAGVSGYPKDWTPTTSTQTC